MDFLIFLFYTLNFSPVYFLNAHHNNSNLLKLKVLKKNYKVRWITYPPEKQTYLDQSLNGQLKLSSTFWFDKKK